MTKQETIQVLQSIEDRAIEFPNMTECDWVAIAAAKRHLTEEPVSNDLEAAAKNVGQKYFPDEYNIWARPNYEAVKAECAFKDGAKWQKENLWKPADGNDLPEIDKEVIVLRGIKSPVTTDSVWGCEVAFAHRPNPDGWDGRSITTGKVEHYDVQTYGKGGWNIPDVKYWLDLDLPKTEE